MPSKKIDPLGTQLRLAIGAILRSSKRDLPQAIARAQTYLAWVRRFEARDELVEEQKYAAIATFRKLIAILEARRRSRR
jgi:hypothetical protein